MLDLVFVVSCLLFTFPVFLLIALAVKLTDGGRILYSHRRVGRGGREFGCLKFRTMVANSDEVLAKHLADDPEAQAEWLRTRKLKNDPRITRVGQILRVLSLDELPQLFNVLKGDMSLVGPRPVVAEELRLYGKRSPFYLSVRPGLTGLWQISGRSELSYEDRVDLDCRYVETWCLRNDIAIILRTIPAVCTMRGSC